VSGWLATRGDCKMQIENCKLKIAERPVDIYRRPCGVFNCQFAICRLVTLYSNEVAVGENGDFS
jgi:hypothetical protein